ncbi:unnamed protein product [Protopolystoma xenopodis]|uniref:Uncharacterized protein n=1 Tax=Protopolystoma xenopodis TaxID=117903 RepID=A0A3S5ACD1_9PLAT|nr:unnamed protein product [Protopolystoma xenopodis]
MFEVAKNYFLRFSAEKILEDSRRLQDLAGAEEIAEKKRKQALIAEIRATEAALSVAKELSQKQVRLIFALILPSSKAI